MAADAAPGSPWLQSITAMASPILGNGGGVDQSFLLEERYQQLERNFNAVVQELKVRPGGSPPQLQALCGARAGALRAEHLVAQLRVHALQQRLQLGLMLKRLALFRVDRGRAGGARVAGTVQFPHPPAAPA